MTPIAAAAVLCALALALFAWLQTQRREGNWRGWMGFWALLTARYALLALEPARGSVLDRYAGVCAVAALAMLIEVAWSLWAEAGGVTRSAWRHAGWGVALTTAGLTLAPRPWSLAAVALTAVLVAATAALLGLCRRRGPLALAAAVVVWGAALIPNFPAADGMALVAPAVLSWAMLAIGLLRSGLAAHPASLGERAADRDPLFRQSVRRSREFEILTHIGTALSSALDSDALLLTIHTQLRKLMDVRNFYVAFEDRDHNEIRFAFEVEEGQRVLPRNRARTNALTEHVIATGRPLLISRDVSGYIHGHGLTTSGRVGRNYMAVPVMLQGEACGVIAVQSYERDDAYDTEHLHMLEILASQAGVALDNARLFGAVQRDAGQKAFLNHIAQLTISTLSISEMLHSVAEQTASAFQYDHILVLLRSQTSDAEEIEAGWGAAWEPVGGPNFRIAASAGAHPMPHSGRAFARIPWAQTLGARAAQSGETESWSVGQADTGPGLALCPAARSGLALPIRYGGQLLGVLHLESHLVNGFSSDQTMVLQTLADQIAVALNHASLFQQMQHQAITDSLTGLKTRRFFMEALEAEWQRARAEEAEGRVATFAVVLVDLDEFKPLNDRFGHLEGDRVLVRVARLLEQKSRASSVVARFGGDEFIILVPACPPEAARALPVRLAAALNEDPVLAQRGLNACFGLAIYPESGRTVEELLHLADADMYRTKQTRQHRRAQVASTADNAARPM